MAERSGESIFPVDFENNPTEYLLKVASDILEYIKSDNPCRIDHHGACQEHGAGVYSGESCLDQNIAEWLEKYTQVQKK